MTQLLANIRNEMATTSTPEEMQQMEQDCIENFDSYYMLQHAADLQRMMQSSQIAASLLQQQAQETIEVGSDDESAVFLWEGTEG